jgi:hypothetical protein
VNGNRDAAGAGIAVITCQRDLTPLVEPALRSQRERVCGDHQAAHERASQLDEAAGVRIGHH